VVVVVEMNLAAGAHGAGGLDALALGSAEKRSRASNSDTDSAKLASLRGFFGFFGSRQWTVRIVGGLQRLTLRMEPQTADADSNVPQRAPNFEVGQLVALRDGLPAGVVVARHMYTPPGAYVPPGVNQLYAYAVEAVDWYGKPTLRSHPNWPTVPCPWFAEESLDSFVCTALDFPLLQLPVEVLSVVFRHLSLREGAMQGDQESHFQI
jgi:hypothetical protein